MFSILKPRLRIYNNYFLNKTIKKMMSYNYDLFVIGGGSGGLSASKEAAKLGAKVGLADYVKPTPIGTKWGLGGTCVNVGCIPKKMMHYAGSLYESISEYEHVGHPGTIEKKHDWEAMKNNVQLYIKKLNFSYKNQLRQKKVVYYNKQARMIDPHTIELTDDKGKKEIITSNNIIIATGGRPNYLDVEGSKEYCITSDDIFSLNKPPGKTLVIGASYISLECGGFLNALGYDTTIMVRSTLLRNFDQGMANKVGDYMAKHGVKFLKKCIPLKFEKDEDKIKVDYKCDNNPNPQSQLFDTVLLAIGRTPETTLLGIKDIGVGLSESGKIIVDKHERSNIPNIYAIGDCAENRPELTPPAIMAGKLLAQRLFGNKKQLMDYENIATTVFTPLEYGACGVSEEEAYSK